MAHVKYSNSQRATELKKLEEIIIFKMQSFKFLWLLENQDYLKAIRANELEIHFKVFDDSICPVINRIIQSKINTDANTQHSPKN
jgi:hypothetical protein